MRKAAEAALARRLSAAQETGDLPPNEDPVELACYVMAVVQGMGIHAINGTRRQALHGVVAIALRNWPSRQADDSV